MRARTKAVAIIVALLAAASVAGAAYALNQERENKRKAAAYVGGNPDRAPPLMLRYGCNGCHEIPGTKGPGGRVGPPLKGIRSRVYVGGALVNSPEDFVRWIVNPKDFNPKTAMPVTGISAAEARHVAAYLFSLR